MSAFYPKKRTSPSAIDMAFKCRKEKPLSATLMAGMAHDISAARADAVVVTPNSEASWKRGPGFAAAISPGLLLSLT